MSKYIKLEDAIRKYAEMIADEAYWEHGVGNGKPDDERRSRMRIVFDGMELIGWIVLIVILVVFTRPQSK